ncbi:MAG TPA: hypothetical protein VJR02_18125 [Pyrinomonadaceae bacterium]|nr:hypothetical protein [Pyrinomonadaceae bacterium]
MKIDVYRKNRDRIARAERFYGSYDKAKKPFPSRCVMCGKIIGKGDYYVKGADLKFPDLAHMECAKNDGWKKTRSVAPVSNADQHIKVMKKLSPK